MLLRPEMPQSGTDTRTQRTYVTEDNEVKTKEQLLAELKPLPAGYSGKIKITEFQLREFGAIAVATHVQAETEIIEGHTLHAKYRTTDTWRKSGAGWRIIAIASQVMAVPKDPPGIAIAPAALARYAGIYAISVATTMRIRAQEGQLIAERPGRPPQIWLAEASDVFFTPGHPRSRHIFVRGTDGLVHAIADRREGEDLLWTRG